MLDLELRVDYMVHALVDFILVEYTLGCAYIIAILVFYSLGLSVSAIFDSLGGRLVVKVEFWLFGM